MFFFSDTESRVDPKVGKQDLNLSNEPISRVPKELPLQQDSFKREVQSPDNRADKMEEDPEGLVYKLAQQLISAWKPVPSALNNVVVYSLLTCLFLVGGLLIIGFVSESITYRIRYDNSPGCQSAYYSNQRVLPQRPDLQTYSCDLTLIVDRDMAGPVIVKYQIQNFYQNHRKYQDSISDTQLQGLPATDEEVRSKCSPFSTNYEMGWFELVGAENKTAYPCGAIAKSMFNDSFALYYQDGSQVVLDQAGISQSGDDKLYKQNSSLYVSASPRVKVSSEAWRVWARLSSSSTVLKNYAQVKGGLKAGTYTLRVVNRYPVNGKEGMKTVVLNKSSFFGVTLLLGRAYLGLAGVCFVLLCLFLALTVRQSVGEEYDQVDRRQKQR